ncbi:hypothetical protein HMPREF9120_02482 [Neisseria sp. oral taxon 020 str. F0370]|nr:hypothetical protein HMPREF9120_02482 [Neisseria sp. oral taxon 020 str. F0370]
MDCCRFYGFRLPDAALRAAVGFENPAYGFQTAFSGCLTLPFLLLFVGGCARLHYASARVVALSDAFWVAQAVAGVGRCAVEIFFDRRAAAHQQCCGAYK